MDTLRAREGACAPREPPAKCPALAPMAPAASPASCHAAWSCSPGPRFAAGVCLLRTPRTEGRGCLHGEGGWSSGGPRSRRSQSLLAEFRPDFREWKLPGPSLPPGGRVGQFEPGQDSSLPRQGSGLSPPAEPVGGRGFRSMGLAPPGAKPCRPPAPAPGAPVFSGHSALRGWESCREVCSTGKLAVFWVARRASLSPDRTPGTLLTGRALPRVGPVARGAACGWGPSCACAAPRLGPKLTSRGSDKSHLLGASPLFFHP